MKSILFLLFFGTVLKAAAQPKQIPVGTVFPPGQTPVHDPVLVKEKNTFYLFATGAGIAVFSSKDLKSWTKEAPVFSKPPVWALAAVQGFKDHIWAPDISFHNGLYYLYYSVSVFGKNTSCIGVAVNKTLDKASADFNWVDKGLVLQSVPNRDAWNAIDPNLVLDKSGAGWLAFGSFWDGIKLVKLADDLCHIAQPQEWRSLASRRGIIMPDNKAGNSAVEAPFIFQKDSFYYLFVSVDFCCKGEKSDYKIVVGRSKNATGPFVDKDGTDLMRGGGTLVRKGNKAWYGVGHNAVCQIDGQDYLIYHGYDATDGARSKLIVEPLRWSEDGWPIQQEVPLTK